MARSRSSKALVALLTLGVLYALSSVDWRGQRPALPPRVALSFHSSGGFAAGAARVDLRPALPAVVAGYPPPRPTATESGPLFARALALRAGDRAIAVVCAEVLEIPETVAREVREKGRSLGLADVVVTATHSHSSFGGYDARLIARVAATGRFDPSLERHLVGKLGDALVLAQRAMKPAVVRVAQASLAGITFNRDEGGALDDRLTVIEVAEPEGGPIARVAVFGSHATLAPRGAARVDGDWPGRAMEKLEEKGGVGILLQGAVGDVSCEPPPGAGTPAERVGATVAQAALQALQAIQGRAPVASGLGFAAVEVGLPRAEADAAVPGFLRRPVANVLDTLSPRTAQLAVVRLPGLTLLFVPAEATVEAARILRERVAALAAKDESIAVVSLAQGYLGYAESPAAVRAGRGEAKRSLFEPELLERLAQGLAAGVEATRAAEAKGGPP